MTEAVTDYAAVLAMALLGLLTTYAGLYINKAKHHIEAEINKIAGEREKDLILAALNQADLLAGITVKALEQTLAKDLRMAVKSGKADKNELASLLPKAMTKVYDNMKPEYLKVLEKNMHDVKSYLTDLIESKVLETKAGTEII